MKATLVIPTLDEVVGMKAIMPHIDHSLFHQILVVDGGSTDGTVEWARENGYTVIEQTRPGIRFAYYDLLDKITGDVIVTFSPDGNCIHELFPQLLKKMENGYDMVIVSRYKDDAKSEDDDIVTAFGNWFLTTTVNVLHGGRYTDAMGIYRAYRTQLIYDLDLDKDESYALAEKLFRTVISWEPLLSIRAAKRKLKVAEIPGDEPERIGGVRKLQIFRWGAAYFFQMWYELFFWK
ncbi:MAG: histidinol phosphate phosphatase [Rhodospirillaceae bacterium]|jgi:glycosyltransferase involved in cell wall biosynthesis|nr:histidinol phosphate phosphatase [Rhodospirillaceae bacterium]|tara:strand:+ start:412 stop:1116 length:705 start_codon:yes stop_codon:yes gene_type:complete